MAPLLAQACLAWCAPMYGTGAAPSTSSSGLDAGPAPAWTAGVQVARNNVRYLVGVLPRPQSAVGADGSDR
ncbi:hypothetical protein GCM10010400_40450 [Streptomyces aculeolatus]